MRKNFMKKVVAGMLTAVMAFSLTACGGGDASTNDTAKEEGSSDVITVGFSQVGAESDWRTANSESMKSTFTKDNGYELIFDDAQQKQENQISAIRNFIQQDVDYIVLAPVTETGWDAVLGEAKQAGIPVIIVDRMVDVKDDSLYTAWVGSNFELEGKKAAAYLDAYMKAKNMKDMKLEFGRDFPVEKFRNDFKSIVWQNIRQYGMPVKNGVCQLIQYLEVNNIRYAVATSNDRAMALELLEAADLRGVFEYMVCGDEVEHGKPFPDIYQKAADMLGVNIKHTLVIEDSYNGIRAGHAAGANVIMVPDLVQPTDEIRQMTDYVVSDLGKVISCISNF